MREWLSAGLFLAVLVPIAVVVGNLVGLNPILSGAWIAAAYFLAVLLDLLPPGRQRPPIDPADALAAAAGVRQRHTPVPRAPARHTRIDEAGFALLGAALGMILLAAFLSRPSGPGQAVPDASAVAGLPAPSATDPDPTPSAVPWFPQAAATASRKATPTPAPATPSPTTASALSGTWQITDTVTTGPGKGQQFQFLVALVDMNGVVTGSGNGLTIVGQRDGDAVNVRFVRPGSSGTFTWRLRADGSMSGTFTDSSARNSGTSVARRQ